MEEWTILVVDDEEANRAALEKCLLRDYRVIPANSVKDALHILEEEEIDVIVSDLQISELTGMDLFMRARVTQPEAIRMLIADDTNFKDMVRIINDAAFYQFIPKPWHPDQLLLLMRNTFPFMVQNCGTLPDNLLHSALFGYKCGAFPSAISDHAKGDNRWQLPVRDSLCWPYGLAAYSDTVLICDSANNRLLLWQLEQVVQPWQKPLC